MPKQQKNKQTPPAAPSRRSGGGTRVGGKYVGRFEREKAAGGKKKKGGKIALIVVLVVLLAIIGVAVWLFNHFYDNAEYIPVPTLDYSSLAEAADSPDGTDVPTEGATEGDTEPTVTETVPHVASRDDYLNILLVGQAARAGDSERFADTMILCTINTHEKTLTMTSFLRDTYARRPEYTDFAGRKHNSFRDKLTKVYHMGSYFAAGSGGDEAQQIAASMELMNMALYVNFGVEVDYNVEVDFDIFVELVDLLGGVSVELSQSEADYLNADDRYVYRDVPTGRVRLYGLEALSYVRMRKVDNNESDILRTDRQRQFMEELVKRVLKKTPTELMKIADTLLPMVKHSVPKDEVLGLITELIAILPELTFVNGGTCPANYEGAVIDIQGYPSSILYFNEAETKAYMRALTLGEGVIPTETTAAAN